MSFYLQGKRILITGAGRGIGKRLAIGLAAKGATVGLIARTKAEIDLTHLEIQHAGGVSLRLPGDVRELDRMIMAAERMRASVGGTDVLIAAAGVQGPIGLMHDADTRAWRETFETNVFGVMHACRAVLPEMVQRRAGKIIVVSGGGSLAPRWHLYQHDRRNSLRRRRTRRLEGDRGRSTSSDDWWRPSRKTAQTRHLSRQ